MFGSFLPSLWSSINHSLLGSRSRHCYAIKCRSVLLSGISTLPNAPPLVVNVSSLFTFPEADIGQTFVKRLGVVPGGLDGPMAVPVHIAELPSRLVTIRRDEREPI